MNMMSVEMSVTVMSSGVLLLRFVAMVVRLRLGQENIRLMSIELLNILSMSDSLTASVGMMRPSSLRWVSSVRLDLFWSCVKCMQLSVTMLTAPLCARRVTLGTPDMVSIRVGSMRRRSSLV